MEKLSIIIPTHNEEKRIGNTLKEYLKFFKKIKDKKILDFEIIVVLNGCIDKTAEVVKKAGKGFKEIIILDFKRAGKGFAIIEGFRDALKRKNELIGFVDGDMATCPESFYDLVKNIKEKDGIIASRGLKKSKVNTSFSRKLTNRGFNFLIRSVMFLPYKDTQCGAKLFKRNAVEKTADKIGLTNWAFDVDLLYNLKKGGFIIKEIPTIWNDIGGSKINLLKSPFQMLISIIRLRLIYSPFEFIVKEYDRFSNKLKSG